MKNILKTILNLKTILACYIGAVGYGVGYNLPNKYNLHPIICLVCCFVLGTIFDRLGQKIVNSNYFNKSKRNKTIVAIVVYMSYLLAWLIAYKTLDYDLDNDFLFSIYLILAIQVILLIYKGIKDIFKDKISLKKHKSNNKIKDKKLENVQGGSLIKESSDDNIKIDNVEFNGKLENRDDPYL